MYAIEKSFTFSAAHRLDWISDPDHPCSRIHGHNYKVVLCFSAERLDALGFVVDTHHLAFFRRYLDQHCEHRNLNTSLPSLDGQTTGERLALHFADVVLDWMVEDAVQHPNERGRFILDGVRVCETETVCAEWWR